MKGNIAFTIIVFASVVFTACEKNGACSGRAGEKTTKVFDSDSFAAIHVHGVLDVLLIQDTVYKIQGIGGGHILENLEVTRNNDEINLYNKNKCAWIKGYGRPTIEVHFKNLKYIDIVEASYVYSKDTLTDPFDIVIRARLSETDLIFNTSKVFSYNYNASGGRYIFRGKMDTLHIEGYYSALYDASELKVQNASIKNYSVVDYKVWVENELRVELHSTGNILYKGAPTVIVDTAYSTGEVKPIG